MSGDGRRNPLPGRPSRRPPCPTCPTWFLLPAAVVHGVPFLVPTVASLWFSLTRWTLAEAELIGLANVRQFFSEPFLVQGVVNTLIHAVLTPGPKSILGLLLAVLLTSQTILRGTLRTPMFLPVLVSTIGVGWLVTPSPALIPVALVDVSKGVGLATVILMAGTVSIPQGCHAAAIIDGAGSWRGPPTTRASRPAPGLGASPGGGGAPLRGVTGGTVPVVNRPATIGRAVNGSYIGLVHLGDAQAHHGPATPMTAPFPCPDAALLGAAPPDASDPLDALDAVACGVLVLDACRVVTHVNAAAVALLDVHRADSGKLDALLAALARAAAGEELPGRPGGPALRVGLAPDQTVECIARPLGDGRSLLTLVDVTPQLAAMQLAQRDPLTGLANRTGLRDRLGALLGRGGDAPVAVLCLDLDRFKAVNDTLGHPTGDALLVKVAERLRGSVRGDDVVARMGGDEFTILHAGGAAMILEDGAPDRTGGATALAARLVDLVGRSYLIDGRIINVGASIGVALAPDHGRDPDDLLKKADLALYRAKADGRGTHRFYEAGLDAHLQSRRTLEIELRKALPLRELALEYQPQVSSDTGEVCGFEALLRWTNPRLGAVPPSEFVPMAEELGLILSIGEWALRTACKQATAWPAPTWVAVNLSPVQLRSPRLIETVASALAAAGLDPQRLELEVTEGTLFDPESGILDVLGQLRALGVRVSMDDFGTGCSALGSLQRFSFDRIKIDQCFVRGSDAGGTGQAIVRAIAGLGASLGMRTTAEGVETVEQLDQVRRQGCTEVQGFLTGRPLPAAAATALLRPSPVAHDEE